MINSDRLVKTFCDIVKIDSVSGEEDEIAKDLTSRLENLGLTVEADDYGNGQTCPNGCGEEPDAKHGRKPVVFETHEPVESTKCEGESTSR